LQYSIDGNKRPVQNKRRAGARKLLLNKMKDLEDISEDIEKT